MKNIYDNNSEEFKVLLKHQKFDPDQKVSKINDIIDSFRSISKNSIDMYSLNSKMAINFGIKYYYGIDDFNNDGTIVTFRKMTNCVI